MAITRTETQVKWSTANTLSVSSGSSGTSDSFSIAVDNGGLSITLKGDNGGTPAAGDTVDFYILLHNGDPDADADVSDEYASADSTHGRYLGTIDTNVTDPAIIVVDFRTVAQGGKIYAENNAASNSITVSAQFSLMDLE